MIKISHEEILNSGNYDKLAIKDIDFSILRKLYKFMLRLRKCQEAIIKEYHPANEMRCPVHFCTGQEAVPAVVSVLIMKEDYLFTHHRSHGYFLAKGSTMKRLFAEIYGRETGSNGGMAGSQEISESSLKFYSGAILAGMPGICAGAALSIQLKNEKNVAVVSFGDGATDEGVFWETISYAALKNLPVVFICENNKYATYSPQLKRQLFNNISERVNAFGVRSFPLFGNDVTALYSVINESINNARDGKGPSFIEAYTYRLNAHVGPEDDDYLNYRSKEELDFWRKNCPIKLLENKMMTEGILNENDKEKIVSEINDEIMDAFRFAKTSPFPTIKNLVAMNYSSSSPMADKLLIENDSLKFNQDQAQSIPGPY